MSTHGLIQPIENHTTYWNINGTWETFKYVEPMSHHNHSNYWVNDVNNWHHDPIGLEEVWATKWSVLLQK